jgi:hypothetical protein
VLPIIGPDGMIVGHPERHVRVERVVADVPDHGEARVEQLQRVRRRLDGPEGRRVQDVGEVVDVVLRDLLVGHRLVRVRVDEARQDAEPGQIDHVGTGGNRDAAADCRDLLPFDEDDLIGGGRPGGRVDQPAGADGRDLGAGGRRGEGERERGGEGGACGHGSSSRRPDGRSRDTVLRALAWSKPAGLRGAGG